MAMPWETASPWRVKLMQLPPGRPKEADTYLW
jgi:hypothetical protein